MEDKEARGWIPTGLHPWLGAALSLGQLLVFLVLLKDQAHKLGSRVFTVVVALGLLVWMAHIFGATRKSQFDPNVELPVFGRRARVLSVLVFLLALPPIFWAFFPHAHLRPVTLSTARIGKAYAIDVYLTNGSESTDALLGLGVTLHVEPPRPLFSVARTVYNLDLGLSLESKRVEGSSTPAAGAAVSLPVTGSLSIGEGTGLTLALEIPCREELEPGRGLQLTLTLPERVKIRGTSGASLAPLSEFCDGNPPTDLRLTELLSKCGRMSVTVRAACSDGRTGTLQSILNFPSPP